MSVPDTMRMDLADPRIYDSITLDRQQALALVNEVDSLRDQAKRDSAEIDRLQDAIFDAVSESDSRADAMAQTIHDVREQRDQLLAQLEQLCDATDAELGEPVEARDLHLVMCESRDMITAMKKASDSPTGGDPK